MTAGCNTQLQSNQITSSGAPLELVSNPIMQEALAVESINERWTQQHEPIEDDTNPAHVQHANCEHVTNHISDINNGCSDNSRDAVTLFASNHTVTAHRDETSTAEVAASRLRTVHGDDNNASQSTNTIVVPPTDANSSREDLAIFQTSSDSVNKQNESRINVHPNNELSPDLDKSNLVEDENNFVAIELVESTNNEKCTMEEQVSSDAQEQAPLLTHDKIQFTAYPSPQTNAPNSNIITRKKLYHPILTPLTKLPWDRIASSVGSCDLLFNCKYSMRQVEDEVREEKTTIEYEIHDEEEEDQECDVEELGLHCCSMLDDSDDDEGDLHQQQLQKETTNDVNKDDDNKSNLEVLEEQKTKSWKGTNPTLDMMLYRQFLEE